jgi:hypothetical protein
MIQRIVKSIRARMFSRQERMILMTAALNHASDATRAGGDRRASIDLAKQLAPKGWLE